MNVLKVENLSKKVGKKEILKDVSFSVNKGDILAFIGPNGAGKTTTIKCILGLEKITKGTVTINGFNIKKDFVKAIEKVGCIVESPDVYMYLSGYDNLKMQASYYKNISEDDINEVIREVGLENRIFDKVSKYSLGMRQRLGIAIALINKPDLLLLDEPTNGLDPEGIKNLRDLLKKLAKDGMAIVISSHNLSELENFCNKVLIIKQGKVTLESSIQEVKQTKDSKYIFKVNDTSLIDGDNINIIDNNYFSIITEEEDIPKLIKKIIKIANIYEIKKEDVTLEEAFIRKAGGNKID